MAGNPKQATKKSAPKVRPGASNGDPTAFGATANKTTTSANNCNMSKGTHCSMTDKNDIQPGHPYQNQTTSNRQTMGGPKGGKQALHSSHGKTVARPPAKATRSRGAAGTPGY